MSGATPPIFCVTSWRPERKLYVKLCTDPIIKKNLYTYNIEKETEGFGHV
jgi:hypothetical protein